MKIRMNWSGTRVRDQGSTFWLANDPRSAVAMIRWGGDGRGELFDRFEEIKRIENPAISVEEICEAYACHMRNFEATAPRDSGGILGSRLQMTIRRLCSYLFPGVLGTLVIAVCAAELF